MESVFEHTIDDSRNVKHCFPGCKRFKILGHSLLHIIVMKKSGLPYICAMANTSAVLFDAYRHEPRKLAGRCISTSEAFFDGSISRAS